MFALHKLEHNFEITGNLLAWLRDYLSDREQYTVINGVPSENTKVAHGIPQGSVLGPILFALYTSDLPKAVNTATTFLYADDTTMYCVGESVDKVINAEQSSRRTRLPPSFGGVVQIKL